MRQQPPEARCWTLTGRIVLSALSLVNIVLVAHEPAGDVRPVMPPGTSGSSIFFSSLRASRATRLIVVPRAASSSARDYPVTCNNSLTPAE